MAASVCRAKSEWLCPLIAKAVLTDYKRFNVLTFLRFYDFSDYRGDRDGMIKRFGERLVRADAVLLALAAMGACGIYMGLGAEFDEFKASVLRRAPVTLGLSFLVSLLILGFSAGAAALAIRLLVLGVPMHGLAPLILRLFLSVFPIVFVLPWLRDSLNLSGFPLAIVSLTFSGLLIYYFSDQIYLDLVREMEDKPYVKAYEIKNHGVVGILRERIFLNVIRYFPACWMQVAAYTLFTDMMIFGGGDGKGIMSEIYIIFVEDIFQDKRVYIFLMMVLVFLMCVLLYNLLVKNYLERKITGRRD